MGSEVRCHVMCLATSVPSTCQCQSVHAAQLAGVPCMCAPLACAKPLRTICPSVDTPPPPRPIAAIAAVSASSQHTACKGDSTLQNHEDLVQRDMSACQAAASRLHHMHASMCRRDKRCSISVKTHICDAIWICTDSCTTDADHGVCRAALLHVHPSGQHAEKASHLGGVCDGAESPTSQPQRKRQRHGRRRAVCRCPQHRDHQRQVGRQHVCIDGAPREQQPGAHAGRRAASGKHGGRKPGHLCVVQHIAGLEFRDCL